MTTPIHILTCWDHYYGDDTSIGVIEDHEAIVKKNSFAWWGKLFQENDPTRVETSLEPAEYPLDGSKEIIEAIREQCKNGIPTYLYVLNPDPTHFSLKRVRIKKLMFGFFGTTPSGRDWYEHVPGYYFKDGIASSGSTLKYTCRYWFKIVADKDGSVFQDLEPEGLRELFKLQEARRITLSRPNFFPMPITEGAPDLELVSKYGKGHVRKYVDFNFGFVEKDDRQKLYRKRWREAQELVRLGKYRNAVQDYGALVECLLQKDCKCGYGAVDMADTISKASARGILSDEAATAAEAMWNLRKIVHLDREIKKEYDLGQNEAEETLDRFQLIYFDIENAFKRGQI